MLYSLFRYYIRVFNRNRIYTFFNVGGLSLGLAISLIVILYLEHEATYDRHYDQHEQIYRVATHFELEDDFLLAMSAMGLGPLLEREYENIESFVRIGSIGDDVFITYKDKTIYEDLVYYSDTTYFDVFLTPFIEGDPRKCFKSPNNIVITQSLAFELFGNEPALGNVISTSNNSWVVSGVISDPPQNTHVKFRALLPAFSNEISQLQLEESLWETTLFTYIKLDDSNRPGDIVDNFDLFYDKYMRDMGEALGGSFNIVLEPLAEIHLFSKTDFDLSRGNIRYLIAFGGVGLLILILAMINYINMATARSPVRAREAGIRKIMGSDRKSLILQFIGESILLTLLALIIALSLAEIAIHTEFFKDLAKKDLSDEFLRSRFVWIGAPVIAITTGILSGIYPAYQISRFSSLESVKPGIVQRKTKTWTRTLLVSFQITMSITVVILALTMANQINFMNDKYLGYNKDDVILVPIQDTSISKFEYNSIRSRLLENENILNISFSSTIPGLGVGRSIVSFDSEGENTEIVEFMMVGFDYFNTMQIPVLKGRAFDQNLDTNNEAVVLVNDKWLEIMGWNDFQDKEIYWSMDGNGVPTKKGKVVGVTDNFNVFSLHEGISPLVLYLDKEASGSFHVRINSDKKDEVIAFLKKEWLEIDPLRPFEYSFISDELVDLYSEDYRLAKLTSGLSLLAIFMSGLGLLGLTSFITQRKTKEIGIRKILGASETQILMLLYKEISGIMLLSSVLSIPVSWYLAQLWLSNFAFALSINISVFAGTVFIALLFAYLTVSFHAIQASKENPVKVLKYE